MSKFTDADLIAPPGKTIHLKTTDTQGKHTAPDREAADAEVDERTRRIGDLQDALYAESRQSLLVVLQGMDASGKDGTVRRIFDHVNPSGVSVTSFKTPTPLERGHDFLWRCHEKVPPVGSIGVFNRSYYEDVLIVRVHADTMLRADRKDRKHLWQERFGFINSFETLLNQNNTRVLKFFLHIAKEEQRKRFLERQKDPAKHWKLAAGDFAERKLWKNYQDAYEKMLHGTSTDANPWYIVPSDHNWVRNYHIARIVHKTLKAMNPKPPAAANPKLVKMKFR